MFNFGLQWQPTVLMCFHFGIGGACCIEDRMLYFILRVVNNTPYHISYNIAKIKCPRDFYT